MKKFIKYLLLFLIMATTIYGDQGRAGAQFLKIFPGVYGTALGGASSILNESPEVVFWNPAGLNDIKNISATFSHADYFSGIKYENIALVIPTAMGVFSIHGTGLLSGDIRETTVDEPDGTGHYYTANDFNFGIAYGRQMTNKFSVGVSFKGIAQNIDKVNAFGIAFDAGAKYNTGLPGNLSFAFTIHNFGPDMQYTGEGLQDTKSITDNPFEEEDVKYEYVSDTYPLPLSFSYAVSTEYPLSETQTVGMSLENWQIKDLKEVYRLGVTWKYDGLLYLAAGHANLKRLFNPDISYRDVNGSMKSLTLGAGLNVGYFGSHSLWVKYAWEAHEYLQGINRFGLDISF